LSLRSLMPETADLLRELLDNAQEQLRWQQAAAMGIVKQTVADALTTTQLRNAYELCDGSRSATEVGSAVGVTKQSVSNWTRRWRNLGIAYENDRRRVQHLVSLKSLDLPLEVEEH
jgi:hypothetical protein